MNLSGRQNIELSYDGLGNRVMKRVWNNVTPSEETGNYTWYVRDAQGNVLAVYEWNDNETPEIAEFHIYGSSRLGYADFDERPVQPRGTEAFEHYIGVSRQNILDNFMQKPKVCFCYFQNYKFIRYCYY